MTIKAIIFDMGGVLLNWNPLALYQKHFPQLSEDEIKTFLCDVDFTGWNLKQDLGRTFDEGVAELSARFPHYAPLIRAYHEHWPDCIAGPIEGTVELLKWYKAGGLGVYGLTNFSHEKYVIAREIFPFIKMLDDVIVSGEVKLLKPDPAIFRLTLKRIGRHAQECAFIDDHAPNVAAARELGFAAIHYQSPEQVESELARLKP